MQETTTSKHPFAKEVGKTFVVSSVSSAGIWTGMIVAAFALKAVEKRRNIRPMKPTTTE